MEEVELLFVEDTIVYAENSNEPTKTNQKRLELIKVEDLKKQYFLQKPMVFLYTSYGNMKKINKKISFTVVWKILRYTFNEDVQDHLYPENYKILLREVKDLNK